ncbi:MAG: ribonuclease HII [Anaerolineaceae bacterium]|nr:ribonuclease HII [Anaerolineaceae bacterium]MDE0328321.1 ribonuclease HII [Anaerolineaceae bacterium]
MPGLGHERRLQGAGFHHILAMDEAGRGAWAGPLCVGAVCLPPGRAGLRQSLADVRDSKVMSPSQREAARVVIRNVAWTWGLGQASNTEIDERGIEKATTLAMRRALNDACMRRPGFEPDCLLLDALVWPEMLSRCPQVTMIDGDTRSLSIAAASVLAKTWRDAHMRSLALNFPAYGFERHKGYGTAAHRAALDSHGPSPLHRRSYQPLREMPNVLQP